MNARRADYNFGLVPVKLKLLRAMMGSNDLDKLFRFDEKDGTEIIVVPLNDPEQPVRFTVDSFWQWHFAGAYEKGGQIVVDFVRHPDFRSLGELDAPKERSGLGRLTRAFLEPRSKKMHVEMLWEHECELPRIDPRFEGGLHSKVFLSPDSCEHLLAKVNIEPVKVDSPPPKSTEYPSEIVMVPG